MRAELARLGVEELRTPDDVDLAVSGTQGTLMIVVNSICGCAAGKARPGVALALQHRVRPDRVATVFAGADVEATERARSYFTGYRALFSVDRACSGTVSSCGCSNGGRSRTRAPSRLPRC